MILASAGGASRAAFFTVSVVGDILDDGQVDLRRRLFAISGVSGGSVGAAVIRAALDDAGLDGRAPCQRVGRSWFRFHDDLTPPYSWRVCLQALTAGDFLSRPFIGLAFRDLFGFPLHLFGMSDRAALLENAFEDQYRYLIDPDRRADSGLTRAVGEFPHGKERWVPLLALNTTSVLDGRRSIVSDLLTFWCDGSKAVPFFPAAVDLFETLGATRTCADGKPVPDASTPAVRLSSGATASARFPVISPYAGIRNRQGEVDLVVDGGYFENDGLTSARQLAEAMHTVQPDLPRPVILHVTNNPTSESIGDPDVAPRSPRDPKWYDAYIAPLAALVETRDGHAAEAFKAAQESPVVEKVLSFQVYDVVPSRGAARACSLSRAQDLGAEGGPVERIKDLSMSWWLSGAVQAYLDSQVCNRANVDRYKDLVRLVGAGERK
ncbi:hypothetical protein [Methylobacterium nodulans]|uniref:hypothetical protein n=1 Tax=Methylobacterium nodulans TaxID=114616 RepID=UPI0001616195|nr:hypothetical protein [Methylobacterium nodulans]